MSEGVASVGGPAALGPPCTLARLAGYFLRLGLLGFGGPVALAASMRRDLVEERGWLDDVEYDEGLAIATACPGPLAYQLAVYCGFVRFGLGGALSVAVAFAVGPFLLVTLAAAAYVKFSATWQLRALFYGIAPVIVALIARACWNLGRKTLKTDLWAWVIGGIVAGLTVVYRRELAFAFLLAGALGVFLFRGAPRPRGTPAPPGARLPALLPGWGPIGAVVASPVVKLFAFFFKTGLLVFGSGLVIVPFLKAYVVDQYHWLSDRQFLDSVAIGMITPGPVVITATFVGYLLQGLPGAVAATGGIFAPPVLFTVIATPLLRRYRANLRVQGFIRGITSAVVGALVGTTVLVGLSAIGDLLTTALALGGLALVLASKKLPEPLLVAAAALIGLLAYQWLQPAWVLK